MPGPTIASSYICPRCLRASQRAFSRTPTTISLAAAPRRWLSASPRLLRSSSAFAQEQHRDGHNASAISENRNNPDNGHPTAKKEAGANEEKEPGAMSRRLESLTEEGLVSGGRAAQKAAVEDAGFSEELKKRLEARIAGANFNNEFAQSLAQAGLPAAAGKGTRDLAGARPWDGTESVEDASLRMLDDAVKPLRGGGGKVRLPNAVRLPSRIDTGSSAASGRGESRGVRLAEARERTGMYHLQKDGAGMSEEEREKLRREMRERFQPAGRGGPMSIRALESLANERIEDAIARGQFKSIPRGQKMERDYNASNPFLDTTEYFMNKIIQKQEIVPPWIEKQQELVTAAARFRSRLRADWKRHAARMIASTGGSLETQVRRAQAYAEAEKLVNPRKKKQEKITTVNEEGHFSQITLSGELRVGPATPEKRSQPSEKITVKATPVGSADGSTAASPLPDAEEVLEEFMVGEAQPATTAEDTASSSSSDAITPAPYPFRDPAWVNAERSFLELSINSLNALTRSYNLMAPELAKKPYFSLDRELTAAFADVGPQLPAEIRDRALEPKAKPTGRSPGHGAAGVMERFGTNQEVDIWDETGERYGLKEMWRDLFTKKKGA